MFGIINQIIQKTCRKIKYANVDMSKYNGAYSKQTLDDYPRKNDGVKMVLSYDLHQNVSSNI